MKGSRRVLRVGTISIESDYDVKAHRALQAPAENTVANIMKGNAKLLKLTAKPKIALCFQYGIRHFDFCGA